MEPYSCESWTSLSSACNCPEFSHSFFHRFLTRDNMLREERWNYSTVVLTVSTQSLLPCEHQGCEGTISDGTFLAKDLYYYFVIVVISMSIQYFKAGGIKNKKIGHKCPTESKYGCYSKRRHMGSEFSPAEVIKYRILPSIEADHHRVCHFSPAHITKRHWMASFSKFLNIHHPSIKPTETHFASTTWQHPMILDLGGFTAILKSFRVKSRASYTNPFKFSVQFVWQRMRPEITGNQSWEMCHT